MNGSRSCQHHPDIRFGETKRLDLRRKQAFSMYLVEISGIEPLTFPVVTAGKPPTAAMIEMQEVSGVPTARFIK